MHTRYGIIHYLWDHVEDRGALLERAVGEIGVGHITVPVVTGPVRQFRLSDGCPRRLFTTEGGWHYSPRAREGLAAALRPRAAEWLGRRDALPRLCEDVARRGLGLVLRIDLAGLALLTRSHPELTRRNAWGEADASAGVCLTQPGVRELVHTTFDDLLPFDPIGVELVAYGGEPCRPLAWRPALRALADTCFCDACRQEAASASIDADAAARALRADLERLATRPERSKAAAASPQDAEWLAYQACLRASGAAWLSRLAELLDDRLRFLVTSADRAAASPELIDGWDALMRWNIGAEPRIECGAIEMPTWRPVFDEPDALFRAVDEARRRGTRFFDFSGLAAAATEAAEWLRRTLRFARRE